MGAFFGGPAKPPDNVPKVAPLAQELTKLSDGKIKKWGIVGFCWGGKVSGSPLHVASRAILIDSSDHYAGSAVKRPFLGSCLVSSCNG